MFDGSACVSTPPLVKGATFTVTFPAVGNFKLVCLVHPDMTGVVHVLDKAKPVPHDQIFYEAEAAAQAQALLSDLHDDEDSAVSTPGRVSAGGGEISATAAGTQALSVMRFMAHDMVIHAGRPSNGITKTPRILIPSPLGKSRRATPFHLRTT